MIKTRQQNNDDDQMSDPKWLVAVPMETQLRLAERRRELAIMRYKLATRKGSSWVHHEVKGVHKR